MAVFGIHRNGPGLILAAWLVFVCEGLLTSQSAGAAEMEMLSLPAFQINGEAARAHTQGLEMVGDHFYVTARLESARPKRAILARTTAASNAWEVWDVTPAAASTDAGAPLDHPGGFQSDGQRLWIPVAQSVRHGRTVIRVFTIERLKPGAAAVPDLEFPVADHIGALAVATNHNLLLGANWDTETVYVWDLAGHLQRTINGADLKSRNLGVISGPNGHAGVAVQDWKFSGERLYASGLFGDPAKAVARPRSRVLGFTHFLETGFKVEDISLPDRTGVELAQEAMARLDGWFYFVPENLGATNRYFRVHGQGGAATAR